MELQEDYRPSEDEPYMNDRQREYFRRKLIVWREELIRHFSDILSIVREKSSKEPDDADQGSLEADKAFRLRTGDRNRKLLYKINEALERIEDGTYGYCEETGKAIGIKRLEVRPIATLSIEAQERHEKAERRLLRR